MLTTHLNVHIFLIVFINIFENKSFIVFINFFLLFQSHLEKLLILMYPRDRQ